MASVIFVNQKWAGEAAVINHIWIKTVHSIGYSSHSSHNRQPPPPSPSTASILFDPGPVDPPAPWCPLSSHTHLAQEERLPLNTAHSGPAPAGIMPCVHFHILSPPVLCFLSRSHTSATAGPEPRPAPLLSASQHDYKAIG